MENAFSPFTFNHLIYENESAYVLLNKNNIENNLFEKVEEMFKDCYLINKNEDWKILNASPSRRISLRPKTLQASSLLKKVRFVSNPQIFL